VYGPVLPKPIVEKFAVVKPVTQSKDIVLLLLLDMIVLDISEFDNPVVVKPVEEQLD
jgi:hypothetical protein